MKKIIVFYFAIFFLIYTQKLFAQIECSELPNKNKFPQAVNDFAYIINDSVEQKIEQKLRSYFESTGLALIVVTVDSLDGYTDDSYAQNLFDCWKPGGENNAGIIFLVAPGERKLRIHTGYGIESSLTDAQCNLLINNICVPYFKKSKYSSGILNGVEEILAIIFPQEQRDRIKEEEDKNAGDNIQHTKRRNSKTFGGFLKGKSGGGGDSGFW
ncbi:TPM domain-containing protein [Candidatus Falkowbacteria bacterium]|nr:MAG: TPM domain-containing protein [Candidatus Falkowbacteria bacterium]